MKKVNRREFVTAAAMVGASAVLPAQFRVPELVRENNKRVDVGLTKSCSVPNKWETAPEL